MKQNALRGLYLDELRDLYSAENQLVKALPKVSEGRHLTKIEGGFRETS